MKITDLGFGSFSIVDELDQIRTVFLILKQFFFFFFAWFSFVLLS